MGGSSPASSSAGGVYLLDSGVLIRSLRGDVTMKQRMNAATQLYVSSIVLGNSTLGHMVHRSDQRMRERKSITLRVPSPFWPPTKRPPTSTGVPSRNKRRLDTPCQTMICGSPLQPYNTALLSPDVTRISPGSVDCSMSNGSANTWGRSSTVRAGSLYLSDACSTHADPTQPATYPRAAIAPCHASPRHAL